MTRYRRAGSGMVSVAAALCVGILAAACSSGNDPTGSKPIDADDATQRVDSQHLHIPEGFTFSQGSVWPVDSVGTSPFAVRFDGPTSTFGTLRAVDFSRALPEFEDLPCASVPTPRGGDDLKELGLVCPADGVSRISRDQSGRDPDQSLSQTERAVILNSTPTHTQVFVVYGGT